ncbi:MAG: Biopolymer transport protein ExbD/TolR, partial [uncultured Gemmatimonadetes bacterium]
APPSRTRARARRRLQRRDQRHLAGGRGAHAARHLHHHRPHDAGRRGGEPSPRADAVRGLARGCRGVHRPERRHLRGAGGGAVGRVHHAVPGHREGTRRGERVPARRRDRAVRPRPAGAGGDEGRPRGDGGADRRAGAVRRREAV